MFAIPADVLGVLAGMVGTGAVTCYLGVRIRYRGDTWLIAGYRPDSVEEEAGLARLVGGTVIALGIVTTLYGLAVLLVDPGLAYWSSWTLLLLGAVAVLKRRARRYAAE